MPTRRGIDLWSEIVARFRIYDWPSVFEEQGSNHRVRPRTILGRGEIWPDACPSCGWTAKSFSWQPRWSPLSLEDGKFLIVGNVRDITQEESYIRQIRRLGREADQLLEEERDRISREVHDELGQLLTAMNIGLAGLNSHLRPSQPQIVERLDELRDLVARTLASVRGLAHSLRTGILEYRGIQESLRSLVDDAENTKEITYSLALTPPDLDIPNPLKRVIYRVTQEGLTNVVRHSNGTRCHVSLTQKKNKLVLQIRDNGTSARAAALEGGSSLGIIGMKERAAAAGGILRVRRTPKGGVSVTAEFPGQHRAEVRK